VKCVANAAIRYNVGRTRCSLWSVKNIEVGDEILYAYGWQPKEQARDLVEHMYSSPDNFWMQLARGVGTGVDTDSDGEVEE
jgi:hypothetical protein